MRAGRAGMLWVTMGTLLAPLRAAAQAAPAGLVQVQMRNLAFHVDSTIVLDLRFLRGELRRTSPDRSPYLDDKRSFTLGIDSARIGITPAALSQLLNRYTFAYPGSPLRRLTITIDRGQIVQRGLMHGISFTVVGDLTLTSDGELRLHPTSVKAVGIKVGGLMKLFGLHLQKLVNTDKAIGVRIDKDDFLLSPSELLPPPKVAGRVGALEVTDSEIVMQMGPESGRPASTAELSPGRSSAAAPSPAAAPDMAKGPAPSSTAVSGNVRPGNWSSPGPRPRVYKPWPRIGRASGRLAGSWAVSALSERRRPSTSVAPKRFCQRDSTSVRTGRQSCWAARPARVG